jgi:hypothetical protein
MKRTTLGVLIAASLVSATPSMAATMDTLTATPNALGIANGVSDFTIQFNDTNADGLLSAGEITSFSGFTFGGTKWESVYHVPDLSGFLVASGGGCGGCNGWVFSNPNSDFLGISTFAYNYSITDVPLPAALPLFATSLGVMGLLGWRRKKAAAQAAT